MMTSLGRSCQRRGPFWRRGDVDDLGSCLALCPNLPNTAALWFPTNSGDHIWLAASSSCRDLIDSELPCNAWFLDIWIDLHGWDLFLPCGTDIDPRMEIMTAAHAGRVPVV
jgi:hypothetical protein